MRAGMLRGSEWRQEELAPLIDYAEREDPSVRVRPRFTAYLNVMKTGYFLLKTHVRFAADCKKFSGRRSGRASRSRPSKVRAARKHLDMLWQFFPMYTRHSAGNSCCLAGEPQSSRNRSSRSVRHVPIVAVQATRISREKESHHRYNIDING